MGQLIRVARMRRLSYFVMTPLTLTDRSRGDFVFLVVLGVSLFDRGPFLRPDLGFVTRRAQTRSRLAVGFAGGHRRRRRAAALTASSTARGSKRWGRRG